jgi:hypothetical protein
MSNTAIFFLPVLVAPSFLAAPTAKDMQTAVESQDRFRALEGTSQ